MCIHHWIIDNHNQGKCKLCRKCKDFQRENDQVFRYKNYDPRADVTGETILRKAEFYMKGTLSPEYRIDLAKCVKMKIE